MNYEEKYKEALERAKKMLASKRSVIVEKQALETIFPELAESEDERIRKELMDYLHTRQVVEGLTDTKVKMYWVTWLEKLKEPEDKGEISDGYHTFNELYRYRMLYNAAFFNLLPKQIVHKSKRHHDGEKCFGGGWFIVMANLPTGQISNHYELKDWDLFQIPEKEVADEWDGHTPQEAAERLHEYLLEKQGQKPAVSDDANKDGMSFTITQDQMDDWLKKYVDARTQDAQEFVWSDADEERFLSCLKILGTGNEEQPDTINTMWLKSIKNRVQTIAKFVGEEQYMKGVRDGVNDVIKSPEDYGLLPSPF